MPKMDSHTYHTSQHIYCLFLSIYLFNNSQTVNTYTQSKTEKWTLVFLSDLAILLF